jgi:peptidoglycan-associated lipoprotein
MTPLLPYNYKEDLTMKHLKKRYLVALCIIGLFALWGCPKSADVTSTSDTQKEGAMSGDKALGKGEAGGKSGSMKEGMGMTSMGLKPVYFDFDKSFIRNDAKSIMKANADWLKANPKVKIKVAGNCDDRGTKEYNQALGQRRSAGAKKYLVDMGVSSKRISLISYGKEKPICSEQNEECWQKNRRDDFIVVK